VKNLSSTEAKVQYIRTWEALPEHGQHYFIVKFEGARKPELIAVAHNRIVKVNPDNGESLKTWRFSQMQKWHVNWVSSPLSSSIDQLSLGNQMSQNPT
jgi:kindlin 2